jgi:adenosylhomocysteine nucleosidase
VGLSAPFGVQNIIHPPAQALAPDAGQPPGRRADVGILTVLSVEMRAVVEVLMRNAGYHTELLPDGSRAHEARIGPPGHQLAVATIQALAPGPYSAAAGYSRLRERYRPSVLLLVGIAGGIHPDVAVGDVVIGTQVIYYDARKETPAGPVRRGETKPVAAELGHRLNDFLLGGPDVAVGPGSTVRVHCGPIGSGSAVVAYADAELRRYLADFNDKTLAVETEAAGFGQAVYEDANRDGSLRGWLTVRGISDLADAHKHDGGHELAARNAAAVMERLVPYLVVPPPS